MTTLTRALSDATSDKRLQILRLIGMTGSISQAAREAGVSYKAAWQAVDTLANLAGTDLIERTVGGSGGGGATLSAAGHAVLQAADRLDIARREVFLQLSGVRAAPQQSTTTAAATQPPATMMLGLRTSMRNQLRATLHRSRRAGSGMVTLGLRLRDGSALHAGVTRASMDLLDLTRGADVLALFKATAARVSDAPELAPPASGTALHSVLRGTVSRVSRRSTTSATCAEPREVTLTLSSGDLVVGFAPGAMPMRRGQAAWLHIAANAVVVARAD